LEGKKSNGANYMIIFDTVQAELSVNVNWRVAQVRTKEARIIVEAGRKPDDQPASEEDWVDMVFASASIGWECNHENGERSGPVEGGISGEAAERGSASTQSQD
jgi:hypothetical protein